MIELVGPFTSHVVVLDGYEVPYLTAQPRNAGLIALTLDGRYGIDVPVAAFDETVVFLAHAIAVASGFTSHPDGPDGPHPRSPYHRLTAFN